jgi:outer membrane protein
MKRPLVGLLASAAIVPGAWFLTGTDETIAPEQPAIGPKAGDVVQPKADQAERLADMEPAFGQVEARSAPQILINPPKLIPAQLIPAQMPKLETTTAVAKPESAATSTQPSARAPILAAANLPVATTLRADSALIFVGEPVVQQLPVAAIPSTAPVQEAPTSAAAPIALAKAEPAPLAKPEPARAPAFVAEPVVQAIPAPVLAAVLPVPAKTQLRVSAVPTAKPDQPPMGKLAKVAPKAPVKSVAAPTPAKLLAVTATNSTPLAANVAFDPTKPLAVLAKAKPASPPALAKAEQAPVAQSEPPRLPAFVTDPIVQTIPAPVLAAALPVPAKAQRRASAVPTAKRDLPPMVKLARVEPKAPVKPIAAPALAEAKPAAQPAPKPASPPPRTVSVGQTKLDTAQSQSPAKPKQAVPALVHYPAAKLPVGEVALASFSPTKALVGPTPVTKARGAMVEATAAKTVPVGAPASVTYPEPAFGPAEAKFIPAAFASVEPPEQPTSLGSASTLSQAIAYSYETNPRLLAERAFARSADMGYPAARAAFGPRLDASATLAYTRDRDEVIPGTFARNQGWSDTASLILSQPLLSFGRNKAVVGQATANIDFSRESLRLVQNEVMVDVIAAYVGTLREAGAVTIARENVALLQRHLEESNARFAVREITLADVQQVETRLALGRTLLLDSQARLGEVHARFYRAVGMPPGELAPPEPLMLPVSSLADAYAIADADSPLIRAAQARERASRAALAATRAQSLPRVDFRGAADYGSISEYSQSLRGTRLRGQVTLSVPLFDSGARAAESGQLREANAADLQLVASAQRDSRATLATSWNGLLAARLSLDHYRIAVESAQRAWENAQRQERAGMRTTLDVLDLARDLLNVRNSYNAALATEYLARANVLGTLGRLEPQGLAQGLKLYDPADHFRHVRGKGDIPLLTGALAALDGVALPDLSKNRPSPDAAQLVGTAETVTGE